MSLNNTASDKRNEKKELASALFKYLFYSSLFSRLTLINTEQKVNLCLQAEDKALALSFYSVSPPKKSSGFLGCSEIFL